MNPVETVVSAVVLFACAAVVVAHYTERRW